MTAAEVGAVVQVVVLGGAGSCPLELRQLATFVLTPPPCGRTGDRAPQTSAGPRTSFQNLCPSKRRWRHGCSDPARLLPQSPLYPFRGSGWSRAWRLSLSCSLSCRPSEAATPAEQLRGPGAVPEPLMQCAAWLDAYFREPAVLEGLPVPALHHPIFQKGQYHGRRAASGSGSLT